MSDSFSDVPPAAAATPAVDVPPPLPRAPERRLRLWPGLVIVAVQWLLMTAPGWFRPGSFAQFMGMFWGPIIGIVAIAVWWLFASRLRWLDRGLSVVAFGAAATLALFLSHPSLGGMGLVLIGLPWATTAWVAWLLVTPMLSWPVRRVGLVVVIFLAFGYGCLLRLDGVDGSFSAQLSWRWTPTAEDLFLAERTAGQPANVTAAEAPAADTLRLQSGDWPGFRGPNRDGHLAGVRIATDWKQRPPRQVWRHRVGPGWGSFAVIGTRLYTQEQRGDQEAVVCYDAATGAELWTHSDPNRFVEVVSGPGPRATPTFHEGKLYVLGASGLLNCLDAATGNVLWSRDVKADSGAAVPIWGFAASPLIVQGIVTVFGGGAEGKAVLGYRAASGELAWSGGQGQLSYSSTHLARLGGVEQLVMATDAGLTSFHPVTGQLLWQHDWPSTNDQIPRIIQPTVLSDTDLLIGTGMGVGTRRVHLSTLASPWKAEEVWTTRAIKPYFNDLVVHGGNIYGFDSTFFTCVDLNGGKGRWRARGYGSGQVLLLEDQDLLLILSEKGEVALVEANPERHKELARFKALEGKTWNHPVVAHGQLFVRNGEEVACYQLTEEYAPRAEIK